jgi:hypothetical protein
VGVLWAIRDPAGAITDFETGYSNPAMARMIGVQTEASMGRRLLAEAPEYLVSDITEQRRMEEELSRLRKGRCTMGAAAPCRGGGDPRGESPIQSPNFLPAQLWSVRTRAATRRAA